MTIMHYCFYEFHKTKLISYLNRKNPSDVAFQLVQKILVIIWRYLLRRRVCHICYEWTDLWKGHGPMRLIINYGINLSLIILAHGLIWYNKYLTSIRLAKAADSTTLRKNKIPNISATHVCLVVQKCPHYQIDV